MRISDWSSDVCSSDLEYRTKRTVELLWQGNWAYALKHGVNAMFGCASFPGVHPEEHALALSFLHHNVQATGEWAVAALTDQYCDMDQIGRASLRERVCPYVYIPVVAGSYNKKK